MTQLFQVAAKLLGLSTFFWFSMILVSLFAKNEFSPAVFRLAIFYAILIVCSLMLVFSTGQVGSLVGIIDNKKEFSLSAQGFLRAGIILMGLFFFLLNCPMLIKIVNVYLHNPADRNLKFFLNSIANLLPVVLGLFCMLRSGSLIRLLEKTGTTLEAPKA